MLSSLPKHLDRWKRCTRCELHISRHNVCMGEGPVPAKILFIGEAPGENEDLLDRVFIGRAGKLFRLGLKIATEMAELPRPPSMFIANTVGCRPINDEEKNRQPNDKELLACYPRLVAIHDAVQPQYVILLGKVAWKHCKVLCPDAAKVYHPGYYLRMGAEECPIFPRWCRTISEVFKLVASKRSAVNIRPRSRKTIRKRKIIRAQEGRS